MEKTKDLTYSEKGEKMKKLLFLLLVLLVPTLGFAQPSVVQTITVNSSADAIDPDISSFDGICVCSTVRPPTMQQVGDECTLRAAVMTANACPGSFFKIEFADSLNGDDILLDITDPSPYLDCDM